MMNARGKSARQGQVREKIVVGMRLLLTRIALLLMLVVHAFQAATLPYLSSSRPVKYPNMVQMPRPQRTRPRAINARSRRPTVKVESSASFPSDIEGTFNGDDEKARMKTVERQLMALTMEYAPGYAYHNGISANCGIDVGQKIMRALYQGDIRLDIGADLVGDECVASVNALCLAQQGGQQDMPALKLLAVNELGLDMAVKLQDCRIDLQVEGDEFEDLVSLQRMENVQLAALSIRTGYITAADAMEIATLLASRGNNIRKLDLNSQIIASDAFELLLAGLVDEDCQLRELDLGMAALSLDGGETVEFGDRIMEMLFRALAHYNTRLKSLDLSFTSLTQYGIAYLSRVLVSQNCQLERLVLDGNPEIETTGIQILVDAVIRNGMIGSLGLNACGLEVEDVEYIAQIPQIPGNRLKELLLSENPFIGRQGMEVMSKALMNPSNQLLVLHWAHNHMGPDGARNFLDGMNDNNCKLERVDLSYNEIKAEAGIALAETLRNQQTSLRRLAIAGNELGPAGAIAFATTLETDDGQLEYLDIEYNNIGEIGRRSIESSLQSPACMILPDSVYY